ncbi:MAG: valine--tRNA ligase [Legionellales bacterium]|nr:valine--tRNA ligase [Legionellales bacterium]
MEKTYDPKTIENKWYQNWEENQYFVPQGNGDPYCIMIPPPNVTGTLHMGHGFQHSLMDALIRYHRMNGKKTLWQVGTDHAGIATQMVVERNLAKDNVTRHSLGREKFIEKIWDWKAHSGGTITQQMRRLGASVDWSRERFTMDAGLSEAVNEVFITLYEEGLIYRGKRLVNWDVKFLTAISDLEVISEEEDGFLWHIRYPIVDSKESLIIATTRPETMLGDTAVAVHPDDQRYQHLIGKYIQLPLSDRKIPIIADDYVEQDFGTGCVKITPAHDFNDYAIGQRHDLPMLNILTPDAKINQHAPEAYQGLDRFKAREQIINDLEAAGLLVKIEPHKLKVPRGDRSGEIIEPYLTDQWFVKMQPLADPAINAVKKGDIKFVPENWDKTYYNWLNNIEDWCISRQLWWGHQVPAWYDEQGKVYVGKTEAEVRENHQIDAHVVLTQDTDVLDTWFSAALWPFSTLDWPKQTEFLSTFYPTSVLVTGFDIIFFWVARMIMMGLKFTGKVPFKEIYITGLIRDAQGQKMSKSKGNVLDPIDLIDGIDLETLVKKRTQSLMQPKMAQKIEKATRKEFPNGIAAFGTDALRFTFAALASTGRDIRFDLSRLEGYRNFCNKIWNAARYVLMNIEGQKNTITLSEQKPSLADQWILTKLQQTITATRQHLEQYRFDLATQTLHEFVWNSYCDWYLELSKPILTGDYSEIEKQTTRYVLIHVLETILRLLHPFMPFLTEEIWQTVAPLAGIQQETIMLQAYPCAQIKNINHDAEDELEWLKSVIIAIRNIRGEMNISPSKTLPVLFSKGTDLDQSRLINNKNYLMHLAKLTDITWLKSDDQAPACATNLVGEMEVLIPLAGLIDKTAETQRLTKEINKLEQEISKCAGKLSNENFVAKAPAEVITQEKTRLVEFTRAKTQLEDQLAKLADL